MTEKTLVIRPHSGVSGDILVAGLAGLFSDPSDQLSTSFGKLNLEDNIKCSVTSIVRNGVTGYQLSVLPERSSEHRNLSDIKKIISGTSMCSSAKRLSDTAFEIIAKAESDVHGISPDEVHFHEVGALDSIVDICIFSDLFITLDCSRVVSAPLPIGDGYIQCAHGTMMSPAPAVLKMLSGVVVSGKGFIGETVTPTGLALLLAVKTYFGDWPSGEVIKTCISYGTKSFDALPDGCVLALIS